MSAKKLWITGVILFLIFVVGSTPANIALSIFPKVKGLELSDINGTVWSGTAQNVQYNGVDFGVTQWQLSPWSLLLLSLSGDVHSANEDSNIDANINYSLSGIQSDSIKARFPATWIPKLTGKAVVAEGQVLLRIIDFEQSVDKPIKITGSIAWRDAVIQTPFGSKAILGNLQAALSSNNESVLIDLKDDGAPLNLLANIKFTPPNRIVAKGSVKENIPENIANFFRFFAKSDKKGKLVFDYNGIIPGI